jgi:Tetratricopeptide repeat
LPADWADWLEIDVAQGAEHLLAALSVFREPADHNAIVFQVGSSDPSAALPPDGRGPTPPYQAPASLRWLLAACREAGMLGVAGPAGCWQVSPPVASGLRRKLIASGRQAELAAAHRRAAEYWQWHAASWPQDREADVHDLLEARHHLFCAGDPEQASELTRVVCAQLHAWGELRREAALIEDTLGALPGGSLAWAGWMCALGSVSQQSGQHGQARRSYTASVRMAAALGDYRGVARGQRGLAALAEYHGQYRQAARYHRRAAAADRKASAPGPTVPGSPASTSPRQHVAAVLARRHDRARPERRATGTGLA